MECTGHRHRVQDSGLAQREGNRCGFGQFPLGWVCLWAFSKLFFVLFKNVFLGFIMFSDKNYRPVLIGLILLGPKAEFLREETLEPCSHRQNKTNWREVSPSSIRICFPLDRRLLPLSQMWPPSGGPSTRQQGRSVCGPPPPAYLVLLTP